VNLYLCFSRTTTNPYKLMAMASLVGFTHAKTELYFNGNANHIRVILDVSRASNFSRRDVFIQESNGLIFINGPAIFKVFSAQNPSELSTSSDEGSNLDTEDG
jgi:hypothetical protein